MGVAVIIRVGDSGGVGMRMFNMLRGDEAEGEGER